MPLARCQEGFSPSSFLSFAARLKVTFAAHLAQRLGGDPIDDDRHGVSEGLARVFGVADHLPDFASSAFALWSQVRHGSSLSEPWR